MTNTQVENTQSRNWRGLDLVIATVAGLGIGETARQMTQFDQVPLLRVLALIICAFVGGVAVAFGFIRSTPESKSPNKEPISRTDSN